MKREDLPLGLLLVTLNDAFKQRLFEGYEVAGFGDVRPAYHVVFELLRPEGERVIDLARKAQTTKQAMGYLVSYLEERGYLERIPDPNDGRAQIVRRTERGRQVNELARRLTLEIQQQWAAQFGSENMERLIVMLRGLAKSIGADYFPASLR